MKIGVTDQLKVSSLQPAKIDIILQPNYCSISYLYFAGFVLKSLFTNDGLKRGRGAPLIVKNFKSYSICQLNCTTVLENLYHQPF